MVRCVAAGLVVVGVLSAVLFVVDVDEDRQQAEASADAAAVAGAVALRLAAQFETADRALVALAASPGAWGSCRPRSQG